MNPRFPMAIATIFLMVPVVVGGRSILDSIVEAHTVARGGAETIEAAQNLTLDLKIIEPTFELDGVYSATRSGCMRIDAFIEGQHVVSEGIADGAGWALDADTSSTRPQPEEGRVILLRGIENPTRLIGLHEFPSRGHSLSYDGQVKVDEELFEKLTVTYSDGYWAELFLDAQTHLIAFMREQKPMHFETDPTKLHIETRYSDYRTIAGLALPFRSDEVNWKTGERLGTTIVRSVTINSPVASRVCKPPTMPVTLDSLRDGRDATNSASSG